MKMRNLLLTSLFALFSLALNAQTTVFSEDFENPPGSVTSTGSPGWFINNRIQVGGVNSDSSAIDIGSASYLETNSFDCSGLFFVTLTFNNICKAEFFDAGTVEYSTDGGATWLQLIDSDGNPGGLNNCNYLGAGLFRTQGSKFQEANYGTWQPGVAGVVPDNSWWKLETFDISGVAGGEADVKLRFKLADGNGTGANNRTGWYVDDVVVVAAACELINPVFGTISPMYPPTVYNLGPYIVNADVTDLSGLNSVTLIYTINGVAQPNIVMTISSGNTYTGTIPAVNPQDEVCYYIEAIDGSGCDNTSYYPGPTSASTVCFTAEEGVTFPYCDNFDLVGIPWTGSGTAGTFWELGAPNFGVTTGANSAPNAWDLNLNSAYTNNANSILTTPELSFQVGAGAKLSFWQNRSVENVWDGTRVEWATNIAGPWTVLGGVGCVGCTNWYNAAALNSSGLPGWTGASNGWVFSEIELDVQFNSLPQVWFRFVFTSDGSVTGDGMSIDDFCIILAEPDDIGANAITQPGSTSAAGSCVDVIIQVKNFGINPQSNFPVSYTINGGSLQTANFPGTLTPGATGTITLPCATIPSGPYTICAYTGLTTDTNPLNDTTCISGFGLPTIAVSYSQQYCDNFDSATGWAAVGSGTATTQWELGPPNFGATNNALSPPNAWDVNLNSAYGPTANCEVVSPLFDFSQAVDPEISFWRNNNTENAWDGVRLDYSLNGGAWTILGGANQTAPCWVNWYNSTPNLISSGQPGWMGASGGWVKTEAKCLTMFNNAPTVQFRFVFTSDASVNIDGFSFDDFCINIPIPLNASPVTVNTNAINNSFIFPGQTVTFSSPISNPGTTPLTNVNVTLTVNGVPVVTDTILYSPSLASQTSLLHTFSQTWNAAPGVYEICAITSNPNSGIDLNPIDDTTCITISVFDTVTVTSANPYCTDFESGPQWVSVNALTYNQDLNSWEMGTPAQTIINSARSGVNAWMTDLDADYPNRDTSGLFTPVFSVDNTKCYKLSFWHKFDTDPFADGGIVEYSTDNAQTWGHLGFYSSTNPNWFNSAFITGLGGSPGVPGWSGTQSNWTLAEKEVNFWTSGSVIFRFRFGSDNSIANYEGWAIDDFCFEEVVTPCSVGIPDQLSSGLELGQNQPNPFNEQTTIGYSIPTEGMVKITVVNVLGEVVSEPVNGSRNAGNHTFTLSTLELSPGVYYYSLEFDGSKITRKMLITN